MRESVSHVPDLVPARMVNEFAYCPRLFFLEWVSRAWADNDDTAEGSHAHRNVDRPEGRVREPGDDGKFKARSVRVSSERLGLVATIDVLEGADGTVRPVDTKKGSPAPNPQRSHEPERIQVCVQGLILRDAGYQCGEGQLFYASTRERVTVPFTDDLIARTSQLLEDLRTVASTDIAPQPLVDSPKCPRCSLVGICLPDETNHLNQRQDHPVRRLLPRDPDANPLYITEQGVVLTREGGRLEIRRKAELLHSVRLIDVASVAVYGNVQITTQLLRELFNRQITVAYYSYGGWLAGTSQGLPSKHVELRRRQTALAHSGGLGIAKAMIDGKVRNARTMLRRNAKPRPDAALDQLQAITSAISSADSFASLLGHEGAAARTYFASFPAMLRGDHALPGAPFAFDARNRRPPRDAVNCLLSFVYALLVKDLLAHALTVGFDPYLGFYHRPRFGRPALALDLAEEFRPLVGDSVVLGLINNGEISPSDFIIRAGGVSLTTDGRKTVIRAYERRLDIETRHPIFGYQLTYRRIMDVQSRLLAAHVLGEVPDYQPFTTR